MKHWLAYGMMLMMLGACAKKPLDAPAPAKAENASSAAKTGPAGRPAGVVIGKRPLTMAEASRQLRADSERVLRTMRGALALRQAREHKARDRVLRLHDGKLFSLSVHRMRIQTALALFARKYRLNIIPDRDVTGRLTVSFSDLSLPQAMDAMLRVNGFYYEVDGDIIRVHRLETRMFEIDYPRFVRGGSGAVEASVSAGGVGSGAGFGGATTGVGQTAGTTGITGTVTGGTGGGGSSTSITSSDSIDFWQEIETNIKALLSGEEGVSRYAINRLSGVVSVTDRHENIEQIAKFIDWVNHSIHRQVVITAQIVEVGRNGVDQFAIDWERVTNRLSLTTAVATVTPFGIVTAAAPQPSLLASYQNNNQTFKNIVQALKEQGNVRIVSRPLVRTINNQPALIKVGTDRTFFQVQSTTNAGAGAVTTTQNDIPQNVTVGLVMSITPHIAANGRVTLDVSPVISSLTGTTTSQNGSTAPILDIKQMSSVVSVDSGQSVMIGGLMKREKSKTQRKIPLLGDIPLLGKLFRGDIDVKRASELVIFVTPYVI
ncbi:MAG: secretin N-terminal domain-containing protein [Mariprofundaceae bacterium]